MKDVIYHLKSSEGKPVITIRLVEDNSRIFRGVSICGPKDIPSKKDGKWYATRQILKGKRLSESTEYYKDHIGRFSPTLRPECRKVIHDVCIVYCVERQSDLGLNYRCSIDNPEDLSPFELRLLHKTVDRRELTWDSLRDYVKNNVPEGLKRERETKKVDKTSCDRSRTGRGDRERQNCRCSSRNYLERSSVA